MNQCRVTNYSVWLLWFYSIRFVRCHLAEILPTRRKTLSNKSINQSIKQSINQSINQSFIQYINIRFVLVCLSVKDFLVSVCVILQMHCISFLVSFLFLKTIFFNLLIHVCSPYIFKANCI